MESGETSKIAKTTTVGTTQKRRANAQQPSSETRHDGLLVDYGKFTNLTKEVLKNANVMRAKNIRSPIKSPSIKYGIHGARNSNAFSPDSMGTASHLGGGGGSFSIPPQSARISTQNGSVRNSKITKKMPESPSFNIGR